MFKTIFAFSGWIVAVIIIISNFKKRKKMTDEQLTLTFIKGRDGKVIARDERGKVCLLDIKYCKENKIWVNEYEEWRCGVKEEREKLIMVQPITRLKTDKENKDMYLKKAEELKAKFGSRNGHRDKRKSG